MQTPAELTRDFRHRGLKLTPQRQAIFAHLHRNDVHPTAQGVHSAVASTMPGISLRTVYQTLNDLVAMGEIHQVDLGGAARFDPNTDDHHHLVCTGCGTVADAAIDTAELVRRLDGFQASYTTVVVYGICRTCQGSPIALHR